MNRYIKKYRLVILFLLIGLLILLYGATLYNMQLSENGLAARSATDQASYSSRYAVIGDRGDILDRNGAMLVSSTPVQNVMLYRLELLKSEDPNGSILELVRLAEEYEVAYTDTFPITLSAPYEFRADVSEKQAETLQEYYDYFDLNEKGNNIAPSDFINWLRKHYGIDYTVSINDARKIIGIRYELENRVISDTSEYFFAEDVELPFITALLEHHIPGVHISTDYVREYHTSYAAHLLGYVSLMNAEDYEYYSTKGYSMDATVGKDGVERAFEEYLHSTDGSETVTYNVYGEPISSVVTREAKAGNNVYLTIDIGLQAAAENAMSEKISALNAERKKGEELADGGAVVVVDVNTGDTLAEASYPTFDIVTFRQDQATYSALANDESAPLLNRGTNGIYNPGSTYKMATAYAALSTGVISPNTTIHDDYRYTKYKDFQPHCWSITSHGTIDVVGALRDSCNFFFYTVGDMLGADAMADSARAFGLGSSTGIEIGDSLGHIATPEYKREVMKDGWWAADNLQAAIGEGYNLFTPVQLADYVAAVANGGKVYNLTLLDKVVSSDYTNVIFTQEPAVRSEVDNSQGYLQCLQDGMRAVASSGTASEAFENYSIPVAAKTGTSQSDTSSVNNGVFVCYAPADDPEIAICVVVQNGGSGSALTDIAKSILDYYFSTGSSNISPVEGKLLG